MKIVRIDLNDERHRAGLCEQLNAYARSETGMGAALPDPTLQSLPDQLAACPTYIGLLAWQDERAVGLLNAFWSVSTFKARPLINVHDLAVDASQQGRGIGSALLAELEHIGRQMHCCKLTLEVLEGNTGASALYKRLGFEFYQLDPANGDARFMQKML